MCVYAGSLVPISWLQMFKWRMTSADYTVSVKNCKSPDPVCACVLTRIAILRSVRSHNRRCDQFIVLIELLVVVF